LFFQKGHIIFAAEIYCYERIALTEDRRTTTYAGNVKLTKAPVIRGGWSYSKIKNLNIRFTPGKALRDTLKEAVFVSSEDLVNSK
jgi:hypothetical protein